MAKPLPEFVNFLLEQLSPIGPVRARGMFGGHGVYLEDLMFGLIADETLYFK
ncbi:MAG: TfoX/Sxy family protein, partial [Pseudomonadales bacterium]